MEELAKSWPPEGLFRFDEFKWKLFDNDDGNERTRIGEQEACNQFFEIKQFNY